MLPGGFVEERRVPVLGDLTYTGLAPSTAELQSLLSELHLNIFYKLVLHSSVFGGTRHRETQGRSRDTWALLQGERDCSSDRWRCLRVTQVAVLGTDHCNRVIYS